MRALCIGRHRFLSDHLALFFSGLGIDTVAGAGMRDAARAAREQAIDVILCDYDLLASYPLDGWERDEILSTIPLVAVSLTRRPDEVSTSDVAGIAGYLYLPTLQPEQALSVLRGACGPAVRVPPMAGLSWPPARVVARS